jgi:peroxiredoxin
VNDAPRKKIDVTTLFFVGLLLLGAVMMGWQELEGGVLPKDSVAPPFTVERLNAPPLELASLKGKVVVVNFWATWCQYCTKEMPYLIKLVKEREQKGVELVAISNDDRPGQREAVEGFLQRYPELKPYAALGVPNIGHDYRVQALPSTYVIDRHGHVSASFQGQASESQLRRWIDAALE